MSLELAAKHIASQGRGPDSMLVHMAPREVAGLQALARAHGGSLTVNPQTGLPEAGFLSSILPMVAGAGLMAMGVPSPWMAGMLVGGGTALASGNLMKGISAGLGAWGGAGIGAGLMGAGEAALADAATTAGGGISETAATAGYTPELAAGTPMSEAASLNPYASNVPVAPSGNMPVAGAAGYTPELAAGTPMSEAASLDPTAVAKNLPQTITPTPDMPGTYTPSIVGADEVAAYGPLDKLKAGVGALDSSAGRGVFMDKVGNGTGLTKYGLAALSPVISDSMQRGTPRYAGSGPNPYNYRVDRGTVNPFPQPDAYGREQRYYEPVYTRMAEGGTVMPDPQGIEQRYAMPTYTAIKTPDAASPHSSGIFGLLMQNDLLRKLMGRDYPEYSYSYNPNTQGMAFGGTVEDMSQRNQMETTLANGGQMYAAGGMSHLGDYSDGGRLLRGPGDGVSDSIPADIEGKRPARLADGEFVVPARIVSELGNGSTEAGARKLYAMMDRVQAARRKTVGKDKVAVNSKAEKLLPA